MAGWQGGPGGPWPPLNVGAGNVKGAPKLLVWGTSKLILHRQSSSPGRGSNLTFVSKQLAKQCDKIIGEEITSKVVKKSKPADLWQYKSKYDTRCQPYRTIKLVALAGGKKGRPQSWVL